MPAGQRFLAWIAYLLGAIGTTGSGIWLMRLISWIHWPGWRMLLICLVSLLLVPKSGVYVIWIRFLWSGSARVLGWPL